MGCADGARLKILNRFGLEKKTLGTMSGSVGFGQSYTSFFYGARLVKPRNK